MDKFDIRLDDGWSSISLSANFNVGSDLTLLTVGDSWTWGDELGKACGVEMPRKVGDDEYRLSKCFGNLLAKKLNANWVQMALPAGNNNWIVAEVEKLIPQLIKLTDKIILIVNFSDHFRSLEHHSEHHKYFNEKMSVYDILKIVEQEYYTKIEKIISKYSNVTVIANSTFTDPVITHEYQTDRTWLELLVNNLSKPCYLHTSGAWCLNEFVSKNNLLTVEYMKDITENYFPTMSKRTDDMQSSPYLLKRCHPNEQGHEIWANYLYQHLKTLGYTFP